MNNSNFMSPDWIIKQLILKIVIPIIIFAFIQGQCISAQVDPTISSIIAGACAFGTIAVQLIVRL